MENFTVTLPGENNLYIYPLIVRAETKIVMNNYFRQATYPGSRETVYYIS